MKKLLLMLTLVTGLALMFSGALRAAPVYYQCDVYESYPIVFGFDAEKKLLTTNSNVEAAELDVNILQIEARFPSDAYPRNFDYDHLTVVISRTKPQLKLRYWRNDGSEPALGSISSCEVLEAEL